MRSCCHFQYRLGLICYYYCCCHICVIIWLRITFTWLNFTSHAILHKLFCLIDVWSLTLLEFIYLRQMTQWCFNAWIPLLTIWLHVCAFLHFWVMTILPIIKVIVLCMSMVWRTFIWSLFLPENSEKVKSVKEIMKSFCQMDNDVEQFLEVANATMTQVS